MSRCVAHAIFAEQRAIAGRQRSAVSPTFAYKLIERGLTAKTLFVLWAADALVDVLLESPGIVAGTYLYYGKQPFDIWGFPLWSAFVNPVMPMLGGALIYKLRPHLANGWRLMGVIPLLLMVVGMTNAAIAFPTWMTLNLTDTSYVWTYLGGFATLALALCSVWIISRVVARPAEEVGAETLMQQLRAAAVR